MNKDRVVSFVAEVALQLPPRWYVVQVTRGEVRPMGGDAAPGTEVLLKEAPEAFDDYIEGKGEKMRLWLMPSEYELARETQVERAARGVFLCNCGDTRVFADARCLNTWPRYTEDLKAIAKKVADNPTFAQGRTLGQRIAVIGAVKHDYVNINPDGLGNVPFNQGVIEDPDSKTKHKFSFSTLAPPTGCPLYLMAESGEEWLAVFVPPGKDASATGWAFSVLVPMRRFEFPSEPYDSRKLRGQREKSGSARDTIPQVPGT